MTFYEDLRCKNYECKLAYLLFNSQLFFIFICIEEINTSLTGSMIYQSFKK